MAGAVVLLSGGLDSATVGAIAQSIGFDIFALTVDYGQRHSRELEAAERLARNLNAREHKTVLVDLRSIGGSALTGPMDVPKDRDLTSSAGEIPITYVPARNTVLLSLALAYAESIGSIDIFVGFNAVDYSGYPDCRQEFVLAFEKLARLATKAGAEGAEIRIHAPIIELSKADIVRRGLKLGVPFELTLSCYDPDETGRPCGRCDSCSIRAAAFREVGVADPALVDHTDK